MSSDATNQATEAGSDTGIGDLPRGFTPSRSREVNRVIADLLQDGGPYASAYTEISRDSENAAKEVDLHAREAADQLSDQGAPEPAIAAIREALTENAHLPAPVSRLVVASERGVLLRQTVRKHLAQPTISWDPLPDLGNWLADVTEGAVFIVAMVDHEGGTVTTYDSGTMQPTRSADVGNDDDPHEHKFKGGGWRHLHFQRSTENVWVQNAEEVIAEINKQARDGVDFIVIGGEPGSRSRVLEGKDDWSADIVELDYGHPQDRDSSDRLEREIHEILAARAAASRLAAVHELQQRRGRGEFFAEGIGRTVEAFVQGQVDRLLLDPQAAAEETVVAENYPGLSLGPVGGTGPLRADRVLIGLAAMTDAEIVITPAATLGDHPAAALLRW
jgi:hypothetical protein